MNKIKELEYLIDAFRSLPGVGSKNAKRFAYYVINNDRMYVRNFAQRLIEAKDALHPCKICNCLTSYNQCEICKDNQREKSLCIVTNIEDFERIYDSKTFMGYYYILGEDVIKNGKPKLDKIDIQKLLICIETHQVQNVVIATSFSIAGEAIAEFIRSKIKHLDIHIYRIGFGIPLNANIDYIDDETIKESFINKRKMF